VYLRRVNPDQSVTTLAFYPDCEQPAPILPHEISVISDGVFFAAGDWIGELPF
jgi:hypothetical protein